MTPGLVPYHEIVIPGIRQLLDSRTHTPIKPAGCESNKVAGVANCQTHPQSVEAFYPDAYVGSVRLAGQALANLVSKCLQQQYNSVHSCMLARVCFFVDAFIQSTIHSSIHLFTHPSINALSHWPVVHSLIHSLHSLTNSPTQLLTHLIIRCLATHELTTNMPTAVSG